jgi:S-adenosylmethionine:tRNA ribosyltransferase-isomerase
MIPASSPERRAANLLAVSADGAIRHATRIDLPDLLRPGDLVVANDAATLPASLYGTHVPSGAPIELRLAGWRFLAREAGQGGHAQRRVGGLPGQGQATAPSPALGDPPPPSRATEKQAPVSGWLGDPTRFVAVAFGAGDHRTRTEDRPLPPKLSRGDRLALGPLTAIVEDTLGHPRLVAIRFAGKPQEVWAGIARHGRPIQYAHVPEPLALWDAWTAVAARPVAFEAPSAGFALGWKTLARLRERGIGFATLTLAAGISSTGDPTLDRRLPFDEPFVIPAATAQAVAQTKAAGGRIIAVGTTTVRALEAAAVRRGVVRAGEGVATALIGPHTFLRVVDAIVSGVHAPGESHFELLRAFTDDETLSTMAEAAEARRYRSHEFGDSVLIERMPRIHQRRRASKAPLVAKFYSTTPMIGP